MDAPGSHLWRKKQRGSARKRLGEQTQTFWGANAQVLGCKRKRSGVQTQTFGGANVAAFLGKWLAWLKKRWESDGYKLLGNSNYIWGEANWMRN
jgi:hypothetical protein